MLRRATLVLALTIAAGSAAMAPAVALDGVTEVCRFRDHRFDEISGMTYSQRHDGVIYLHNDSSGGPRIYAVDVTTCRTLATLTIAGAQARDLEGIGSGRDAKGRPILWVADIGDNNGTWADVTLLRVREPARLADATVTARTYRFTYPDGPLNAEALLSDPDGRRVWVVGKQLAGSRIYRVPLRRGTVTVARPVGRAGGLITDGSISPDGSRFALRDYVDAETRVGLPPGTDPQTVYLPLQTQGEALTWTADGSALLVAGERDDRLLRVDVETAAAPTPTPIPTTPANGQLSPSPAPDSGRQLAAREEEGEGDGDRDGSVGPWLLAGGLVLAALAVIATAEWRRRRPTG